MRPERVKQLRDLSKKVVYRMPDTFGVFVSADVEWNEMLDEIEKLQTMQCRRKRQRLLNKFCRSQKS